MPTNTHTHMLCVLLFAQVLKKLINYSALTYLPCTVREMNHPFGATQEFMIFNTPTFTRSFQTDSFLFILNQSKKYCCFCIVVSCNFFNGMK